MREVKTTQWQTTFHSRRRWRPSSNWKSSSTAFKTSQETCKFKETKTTQLKTQNPRIGELNFAESLDLWLAFFHNLSQICGLLAGIRAFDTIQILFYLERFLVSSIDIKEHDLVMPVILVCLDRCPTSKNVIIWNYRG